MQPSLSISEKADESCPTSARAPSGVFRISFFCFLLFTTFSLVIGKEKHKNLMQNPRAIYAEGTEKWWTVGNGRNPDSNILLLLQRASKASSKSSKSGTSNHMAIVHKFHPMKEALPLCGTLGSFLDCCIWPHTSIYVLSIIRVLKISEAILHISFKWIIRHTVLGITKWTYARVIPWLFMQKS